MALNISDQIQLLITKLEAQPDAAEIVNSGKAFIAALQKDLPLVAVAVFEAEVATNLPWLAPLTPIIDPALKGLATIAEADAENLINAWMQHSTKTS